MINKLFFYILILTISIKSVFCGWGYYHGKGVRDYYIAFTHKDCRNIYVCLQQGNFDNLTNCNDRNGKYVNAISDRLRDPFTHRDYCSQTIRRVSGNCYTAPNGGTLINRNVQDTLYSVRENGNKCLTKFGWCTCKKL